MLQGAFCHSELRLAMSVGRRQHYRLDQIRPRHFKETAVRAKVPAPIQLQAFAEFVAKGLPFIEGVANTLHAGFPERLAGPIIEQVRNRMAWLTTQLEAGLIGGAKAVAMKAGTTLRLILSAWARAVRWKYTRQRCQMVGRTCAVAALAAIRSDRNSRALPPTMRRSDAAAPVGGRS